MYIQSARTNKQTNIVHYDLHYIGLRRQKLFIVLNVAFHWLNKHPRTYHSVSDRNPDGCTGPDMWGHGNLVTWVTVSTGDDR